MDLFDLLIHFLLRMFDILAMRNTHQYASAVGDKLTLLIPLILISLLV